MYNDTFYLFPNLREQVLPDVIRFSLEIIKFVLGLAKLFEITERSAKSF